MSTPHIAALGIDVGGTGIKGAVVDIATGRLISKRRQSATPQPATPATVSTAIAELVTALDFTGPIGIAFPSAINDGAVLTAANLDKSWIGQHIGTVIDGHLPARATYLNDADAATLAEVRYGIGRDTGGLTIMVTFGTGIGTGLAHSGRLVPNAELGHIEIDGVPAEIAASAVARERNNLTWEQWAERGNRYLTTLENLLFPQLLILGGGISRNPEKWVPLLNTRTPVRVAQLNEDAGIIGAALAAHEAEATTSLTTHAVHSSILQPQT